MTRDIALDTGVQPNPSHVYLQFEEEHWWYLARRAILLDLVHTLVPVREGKAVVDIGCGPGANIAALAGDYRCVGIDASAAAVAAARDRFPGVEFVRADAFAGMRDNVAGADVVLLMDVIEHVAQDVEFFRDLVSTMRPGAIVLMTVPADPRLWSKHDQSVGHQRRYTGASLRALWAELPVREMLFTHFNTRLYAAIRLARAINRRRRTSSGVDGTDFKMPPRLVNQLLFRLMTSELPRIRRVRRGEASPYRRGVSLLAVVERTAAPGGGG